jgi:hypothetical protein
MDPARGDASHSTVTESVPARSGAQVAYYAGERPKAERIARRLFHRRLETWEYAGLAGAPHDAQVEVGASAGTLYIELCDRANGTYRGHYYVRGAGERVVMVNDGFHIVLRNLQRRGLGARIFDRQVSAAAALGIERIELVAGRRRDENGYYTWPRFGFEGALPARLRRRLPMGLKNARTVLDLMESEKGRAWWREHGATIQVAFDLTPGSRCRAAWDRYVREKINSQSGPKRNLEISAAIAYGNAR